MSSCAIILYSFMFVSLSVQARPLATEIHNDDLELFPKIFLDDEKKNAGDDALKFPDYGALIRNAMGDDAMPLDVNKESSDTFVVCEDATEDVLIDFAGHVIAESKDTSGDPEIEGMIKCDKTIVS